MQANLVNLENREKVDLGAEADEGQLGAEAERTALTNTMSGFDARMMGEVPQLVQDFAAIKNTSQGIT